MAASQKKQVTNEVWMNESEAARYLGFVHPWSMRKLNVRRYDHRLPDAKQSKYRYRKTDLDAYLKQCEGLPDLVG